LIDEYSEKVVQFYMLAIQENAERSVRDLLRRVNERFKGQELVAVDYMDDGSPIRLKIDIDPEKGEATFDFSGTGPKYTATLMPLRLSLTVLLSMSYGV
jgi:5-oxoprolinase (ATP-hydrolysing)